MTWLQRYWLRNYIRNSIWVYPVVGLVVALLAVRVLHQIEQAQGWELSVAPDAARSVLDTLAASMFTFIVFVSSALLVAVQLASGQLTPRIIGIVFRDPVTKTALTIFVFTFTFTLAAMVRIGNTVPQLTAQVAECGSLLSLVGFLYLIDHVGKALRPSGAVAVVGVLGRRVVESVYRRKLDSAVPPSDANGHVDSLPSQTVLSGKDGVVLAFDLPGLVSLAERADAVIELQPQVGDFVAVGDPLFRVLGGRSDVSAAVLRQSVAFGQERTLEQDPAFAFRILVDIANKGLSPAINDPTTAVLAIDQLHHLLRNVGQRRLDDERVRDKGGRLRLLFRTPDWEDFVHLAVTEIRQYGGESIQVVRRLRAMLENLIQTLPAERTPLLRQELDLLRRSSERSFQEPEDRLLADESDVQGVGGRHTQARPAPSASAARKSPSPPESPFGTPR